ncbi:unnamed protein product [Camellia sinensis]
MELVFGVYEQLVKHLGRLSEVGGWIKSCVCVDSGCFYDFQLPKHRSFPTARLVAPRGWEGRKLNNQLKLKFWE